MANELFIRLLQPEDAEQYLHLRLEALRENPESFATTYEETLATDTLAVWKNRLTPTEQVFTMGAFLDHSLLSVATLVRESRIKLQHKASLMAMYTTPAQRGNGIAKKVLTAIIEQAREMDGLEQINLTVVNTNTAACTLYHSLGFVTYGTERNGLKYNDTYWDEDYMTLNLQS